MHCSETTHGKWVALHIAAKLECLKVDFQNHTAILLILFKHAIIVAVTAFGQRDTIFREGALKVLGCAIGHL